MKVQEQVSRILNEKAEGTFLWIGLACAELWDTPSKDAMRKLKSMPKGLNSLYKKLLDTAMQNEMETGEKAIQVILSFIIVCMRPPDLLELSEACGLSEDEDDIPTRMTFMREHVESCRPMVIIQDDKVVLLHQSVKDFLLSSLSIRQEETHARVAYRCIDLAMAQNGNTDQNVFLDYADQYWADHARMARSEFSIREGHVAFWRSESSSREEWLQRLRNHYDFRIDEYRCIPAKFSLLHVAAYWGLSILIEHVATEPQRHDGDGSRLSTYIGRCDSDGISPIEQSVRAARPNTLKALLKFGAKIETKTLQLVAASDESGPVMMRLLLSQGGSQIIITEDVIKAAAENDQNGREMAELLLDYCSDRVSITKDTVAAAAANPRGQEIIKFLLERYHDQM